MPYWLRTFIWVEFNAHALVLLSRVHTTSGCEGVRDTVQRNEAVIMREPDADNFEIVNMIEVVADRLISHVRLGEPNDKVACGVTVGDPTCKTVAKVGLAIVPCDRHLLLVRQLYSAQYGQ